VIDLVAGAAVCRVPSFEVDSFVNEVRALDRHLSAISKADQSEAVFVCTIMQALTPSSRLVYCCPSDFSVRIPHHQLHVVLRASRVRSLLLFIKLILFRIICWCMYVDEGIVEESAIYSKYAETLVDGWEVCNQMVNFLIHEKSHSKFVFVSQNAGIDVIPIAPKGLWGRFSPPRFLVCGYRDLILP
jgi:hypothetical protein